MLARFCAGLVALASLVGCADDGGVGGGDGGEGGEGGEGGTGAGSVAPLECSFQDVELPLCAGDGCPFSVEGSIVCNRRVDFQIEALASGAPTLLVAQDAPLPLIQVDTEAQTLAELFVVGSPMQTVLDDEVGIHVFNGGADVWRYLDASGSEETLASHPGGHFLPIGAAFHDGELSALAQRNANGLWLATRSGALGWAVEELDILGSTAPAFAVAGDGTPMIGYFMAEGEDGWHAWIRSGDGESVKVPFDIGSSLETELHLVAGPTSWQASTMQLRTGIEIAMADLTQATVPVSAPLDIDRCGEELTDGCGGTCVEQGSGAVAGLAAFSTPTGPIVAFVESHIERQYSLSEGDCGEAGCDCLANLGSDTSTQDLVLVRLEAGSLATVEVGRYPLPVALTASFITGVQRGDAAAIAIASLDGATVRYARLDLPAVSAP